jgi:carboxymethylenebutenolidase
MRPCPYRTAMATSGFISSGRSAPIHAARPRRNCRELLSFMRIVGLNPHTEDDARRFALENFMAFAPDALWSVGGYPGDDDKGGQLFPKIDPPKRTQDFITAARWLKSPPDCTGKIGATGFCFGGSMANTLAVLLGISRRPPRSTAAPKPEDVPKIKAAILINHGALDKALSEAYPAQEVEPEEKQHPVRRAHLSEFGSWFLQ